MKHEVQFLMHPLLACLFAATAFAAEEQPKSASAKLQNGVFLSYTGYVATSKEI